MAKQLKLNFQARMHKFIPFGLLFPSSGDYICKYCGKLCLDGKQPGLCFNQMNPYLEIGPNETNARRILTNGST